MPLEGFLLSPPSKGTDSLAGRVLGSLLSLDEWHSGDCT
jgi:hypothetical protein